MKTRNQIEAELIELNKERTHLNTPNADHSLRAENRKKIADKMAELRNAPNTLSRSPIEMLLNMLSIG